MWLYIILNFGLVITSLSRNLHYLSKSHQIDTYLTYLVLQNLLLPLFVLFILNGYHRFQSWMKWSIMLTGVFSMVFLEHVVERIGVFHYQNWHPGLSFLLWLFVIMSSLLFYHFIHSKLFQKDPEHV